MLPAAQRLSRSLFSTLVSKEVRSVFNKIGTLKYLQAEKLGFSVVISKKNEKSAVKRNKMRRGIYEVVRNYYKKNPERPIRGALFVSKPTFLLSRVEITQYIHELLQRTSKNS